MKISKIEVVKYSRSVRTVFGSKFLNKKKKKKLQTKNDKSQTIFNTFGINSTPYNFTMHAVYVISMNHSK